MLAALHGDFHAAFELHPLAVPILVLLIPSAFLVIRSVLLGRSAEPLPAPLRRAWTIGIVAMIVLWVLRFFGLFGGPAPI